LWVRKPEKPLLFTYYGVKVNGCKLARGKEESHRRNSWEFVVVVDFGVGKKGAKIDSRHMKRSNVEKN